MKRTEPQSIGEIIERVLMEDGSRQDVLERRAAFLWEEVVGPGVNRYTSRRYAKDGVLHVYLTSAPLKNELSFHRSTIINQINSLLGATVITAIELH